MQYTIKQFSTKTKLPSSTLRYYESEGVLPFVKRDAVGNRIYNDENIAWIDFILALRETGMSISNIKRYVELYKRGKATLPERKAILLMHQQKVRDEIKQLNKYLDKINYKISLYQQLEADPTRTDIAI